ncbi:hypothetical protein J1N35_034303 [Gossypium stocksii]|uniref:Uncharacterized protein n=1 Tax=Gossypium stocksii TaxID=47602 RepID=A0A9D3URR1_9ROSI|nr:hypothetical protein J1N35_034303 [Gossypium stocksii]
MAMMRLTPRWIQEGSQEESGCSSIVEFKLESARQRLSLLMGCVITKIVVALKGASPLLHRNSHSSTESPLASTTVPAFKQE